MADDLVTLSQLLTDARAALRDALLARKAAADQLATAQVAVKGAADQLNKVRNRISALVDAGVDA